MMHGSFVDVSSMHCQRTETMATTPAHILSFPFRRLIPLLSLGKGGEQFPTDQVSERTEVVPRTVEKLVADSAKRVGRGRRRRGKSVPSLAANGAVTDLGRCFWSGFPEEDYLTSVTAFCSCTNQ